MAMRETANSLRAYFLFAGVLGLLALSNELSRMGWLQSVLPPFGLAVAWYCNLVDGAFAIGFLVAGLQVKRVLPLGASWIKKMLVLVIAAMALKIALLVAAFGADSQTAELGWSIIRVAVSVYLLANLRRLVEEAMVAGGAPPARVI